MIEAVNSVISNAQLARVSTDQAATLNSFAADAPTVESVARGPVAPYISPYISVDTNFDTAVLQIRDSDTGDVVTQFPSESALQQRRQAAARAESEALREQSASAREAAPASQVADVQQSVQLQAQQAAQPAGTSAGVAQAAIAALSAGAQSGLGGASTVNVTA